MNNFGRGPVAPQYPDFGFVPLSNKQFVQSLDEALNIPVQYNSQMVYFDVNQNLAYDITTNSRGDKSWAIIELTLKETSMSAQQAQQAQQKTIDDLLKRIEELEKKTEVTNGQHNAQ